MKYLFVTQASSNVGFGHLIECFSLYDALRDKGESSIAFSLYESCDKAARLVRAKSINLVEKDNLPEVPQVIVLNTRGNSMALQTELGSAGQKLIVVDELGLKELDCDAVVNFSLNESWHKYAAGSCSQYCLGAEYFPLRKEFISARTASATKRERSILVSLGGADRTRSTLVIAKQLSGMEAEVTYVLGPGYEFDESQVRSVAGTSCRRVLTAPDNFAELMSKCQAMITAGGNTLYEAAYLGVAPFVLWEDPHEKVQGEAFEMRDAALVLGKAGDKSVGERLVALSDGAVLRRLASNGERLVDGRGCERIVSLMEQLAAAEHFRTCR